MRAAPLPAAATVSRQRGFSLVELMIAMVIGMALVLVVSSLFVSSRDNYQTQDEVGRLQENMRTALGLVTRLVRQTQFEQIPVSHQSALSGIFSGTNLALEGTQGSSVAPGSQDQLRIRFQGDGNGAPGGATGAVIDCTGQGVGTEADATIATTSRISRNALDVRNQSGRPWLGCTVDGGAWTALIPDIDGMEVEYGVYSDPVTRNIGSFVDAGNVTDFNLVGALRISLLFRTERESTGEIDTRTYTLGERTYGPFNDKRMRRMVSTTIAVRNRAL